MADKATHYNRKELRNQLLPHAKWDQMSGDEKTVLYQKYNADHDFLKGFSFGKGWCRDAPNLPNSHLQK